MELQTNTEAAHHQYCYSLNQTGQQYTFEIQSIEGIKQHDARQYRPILGAEDKLDQTEQVNAWKSPFLGLGAGEFSKVSYM